MILCTYSYAKFMPLLLRSVSIYNLALTNNTFEDNNILTFYFFTNYSANIIH